MAVGTQEVATRYSEADWTDFAHTGPGTLAGRYMRMFWQPVCRSVDLPSGRAKPIRIMSEDFTLYRGEEDPHPSPLPEGEGTAPLSTQHSALSTAASTAAAHVLAFRCAHRGTQLSTGWVEGEDLRCFYHGWKYDASGQCIEQPAEPEPFCQKIHIRSYPTEEYLGLIFAYFGEGDPPPMVRYPDLEEGFDRGRYEIIIYPNAPCNYFNRIENAVDESHLRFVHITTGYPGCPQIDAKETSYGIATRSVWSNGWINGAHYHMPNACQFKASSREKIAWRVP
ncbi:MAG: hypothetical protein HW416_2139, partial [Chloroflexi bacterium]|nr:hypothetical protein [Chloroflexota bacterium]